MELRPTPAVPQAALERIDLMADEPLENVDDKLEDETPEASRQALIERTQVRLDEVAGIESAGDGEPVVDDDKPEDDHVPTDEVVDGVKDEVEDEPEDDKGTEAAETDEEKPVKPTLPESYRRSLVAYGNWTDEEINAHFEANPKMFLEMAGKLHHNRNAETAGYADAGRQARAAAVQPNAGSAVPDKKLPGKMEPVNAAALIEKHGQEDLVNDLLSPVNDVIQQINTILPQLEESRQEAQRSRNEVLGKQIETFFTAKEMKPYVKVYGDVTKTALTEVQNQNRNKVLEQADAIVIGAKLQRRQLTVDEALLMAHDSVAGEFKEQVIRADLKRKTKKRAKGTTVRPSHRGKPPAGGKPSTRKQLEDKAAAGLKSIFGS